MTGQHGLCDSFYCTEEYKNKFKDIVIKKDPETVL